MVISIINTRATVPQALISMPFLQDLGSGDLASDLYIVAHVVRVGRMLFSESVKKTSSHCYRRPHGVALFRLSQSVLQGSEGEVSQWAQVLLMTWFFLCPYLQLWFSLKWFMFIEFSFAGWANRKTVYFWWKRLLAASWTGS